MAHESYQVPEEVSQYYPQLIDDYYRAAVSARNQPPEEDYWGKAGADFLNSANKNLGLYLAEQSRSRLAEEASTRLFERQTAAQQATEERALNLANEKDRLKQIEWESTRTRQHAGLQELAQRYLGKQIESPLEQAAGSIEDYVRTPQEKPAPGADTESYVNAMMDVSRYPGRRAKPQDLGTGLMGMMAEGRQGFDAAQGLAGLGEKGAMADIIKNLAEPGYREKLLAQRDKALAEAAATPERVDLAKQTQGFKEVQAAIDNIRKDLDLDLKGRDVTAREGTLAVREALARSEAALKEAMTALALQRTKNVATGGGAGGGGARGRTAHQQDVYDGLYQIAMEILPNGTPEQLDTLTKKLIAAKPPTTTQSTIGGVDMGTTKRTFDYQGMVPQGAQSANPRGRAKAESVIGTASTRANAEEFIKQIPGLTPQDMDYILGQLNKRWPR